jgi:DinB family protein
MRKDDVIENLHRTRAELNQLIARIGPDQLLEPGVAGDWSVRDMLLHLAWYESEEAGLIAEDPDYEPSPFWSQPEDEVIRDHYRSCGISDIRRALDDAFQRLVRAVERLSDQDLVTPGRFPGTSAERLPWEDIADNSFSHEQEHIEMIRAWLADR